MPLWNRDELPAELRDKKPQEILDALNRLKELESKTLDHEKEKTDWETKFQNQQTEFDQTRQRLQEMEQNAAREQAQPYMQQPQQPQEPTSMWTDPARYINEQTLGTQLWTVNANKGVARIEFRESLAPRDRRIFQKYLNEVEQAVNGMTPLSVQGTPQAWSTAFNYIKGVHDQEISKAESEGTQFFSEPASRGGEVQPPPPEDKLTAEEEEACRTFHWDPKGYLQRKKEAHIYQSEKGSYARYPVPPRKS